MNPLRIPTLLFAAILAIDGYAANANTVPTASDLQERTLNEQINEANGVNIMSPTATAVIRSAKDLSDDEARQHQALDQARALLRGPSSEADLMATMSMSMPNTVSMMDIDDIINGHDETEDDYKASFESESEEPDGGVSTLHDHISTGRDYRWKASVMHFITSSPLCLHSRKANSSICLILSVKKSRQLPHLLLLLLPLLLDAQQSQVVVLMVLVILDSWTAAARILTVLVVSYTVLSSMHHLIIVNL